MNATQSKKPCSIEGCENPAKGRGWCAKHWWRWRNYSDPLYVKPRTRKVTICKVDDCGEQAHAHGYCGPHAYRFKKYGDPLFEGPGKGVGRNRLSVPSYSGMHKRLTRDVGPAKNFACSDCGGTAQEWSYDGGCPSEIVADHRGSMVAYSVDPDRYSPRCRKCHRRRDKSLDRDRNSLGQWCSETANTDSDARKRRAGHDEATGALITIEETA